jgi:hypothetical protein
MTYRPQYAYPPAPSDFEDESFGYIFDGTTIPALGVALAAGAQANDIQLPTEADCAFLCRGIKLRSMAPSNLYLQLRTPHGDYLQLPYAPSSLWGSGAGIVGAGFLNVPLEPEIESPRGATWTLFLYNPTSGAITPPPITLYGVKRRRIATRRAA